MSRRSALLIAAVLTAAISVPAAALQGGDDRPGQVGIRLVDIPAERFSDPRARLYVIDHVAPGAFLERRIEVTNTTDDPLDVELTVGAAEVSAGAFRAAERTMSSPVVGWTSVVPSEIEVPPGGAVESVVTISVPDDAPHGEHYAVIWAQPPAAKIGNTTVVNRVGIRIYLSVGEGEEPASDFTIDDMTAGRSAQGEPTVEATLTNTGGRALDISGELRLSEGPGGISAGPFAAEPGTSIGVRQSAPIVFHLDPQLPAGPWKARIDASSGLLQRSAEATIVFPDAAGESAEPVEATEVPLHRDRGFLVPLALGLLVLALLLVLLVWFLARRRRKDDEDDDAAVRHPVDSQDATAVAE